MFEKMPLRVIDDLVRHFWRLIRLVRIIRHRRQKAKTAITEFSSELVVELNSSNRFRIVFFGFAFAAIIAVLSLLEGKSWSVYEHGEASWYGPGFFGRQTANGETYLPDDFSYTAAHPSLPLGSYILVKNQLNGRELVVRINDRGPYVKGRILDLNHAAATQLGIMDDGTAPVTIYYRKYHLRERP